VIIRSLLIAAIAAVVSLAGAVPQMLVYGNGYVSIPSGQSQADTRTGTDFGRFSLPMAQPTTISLEIVNRGDESLIISNSITFSGPKGSAFSVESIGSTNLDPGISTSIIIAFEADSNGQYSTDMTIPSNDPSMPNYFVPLRAQVGNNAAPTPDATVILLGDPLLVKYNEKKAFAKYSWNAQGFNLNEVLPQKGAAVRCWYSDDPYLDPADTLMKEKNVKKFAPFNAATIKTLKLKVKAPAASGYFFTEIFLTPEGTDETNYKNNIIMVPFSAI